MAIFDSSSARQTSESLLQIAADVTDEDQVSAAIRESVVRFGRLDVVVNNAGRGLLGAIPAEAATARGQQRWTISSRILSQPMRAPSDAFRASAVYVFCHSMGNGLVLDAVPHFPSPPAGVIIVNAFSSLRTQRVIRKHLLNRLLAFTLPNRWNNVQVI